MRQLLTERYRERLAGVLSCYDRIIVTGTLPGACYAKGMMGFLSARQIRVFDYQEGAMRLFVVPGLVGVTGFHRRDDMDQAGMAGAAAGRMNLET